MIRSAVVWVFGVGLMIGAASAAEPPAMAKGLGILAYPPEDKTAEQIQADDAHCYQWAVDYTGEDPLKVADQLAQQQPEQVRRGQVAGGAAAGAAAGVLIGDNRKAAATGAAIGALGGGIARRQKEKQAAGQQEQAQQQAQSSLDQFKMGYKSCLKARGYSMD